MAAPSELIQELVECLDLNVKAANHFENAFVSQKARADALEGEVNRLKAASTPAVELEKVASAPDPARIDNVIRTLQNRGIVTDGAILTKFANQLKSDPNFALDLVTKIAGFQDPPAPAPGSGIARATKEASSKKSVDSDGWDVVFTEGA